MPKDLASNLQLRKRLWLAGYESDRHAEELWIACSRDLLFWVNMFAWTHDPRVEDDGGEPIKPFITWDCQDRILLKLNAAIGKHDMAIEKSRAMGASWMQLLVFFWHWHFGSRPLDFLVVSRKEQYVDDATSKKSLFWKLDFLYDWMPGWMKVDRSRTKMKLRNTENGSTIDGESTTENIGRGARYTAILIDEYAAFELQAGHKVKAAVFSAANTRMYNSTYQGAFGAFYETVQRMKLHWPERVERLHWSEHPEYRQGLYTSINGRVKLLDEEYKHEPDYQFICDGKTRSPWYDEQCKDLLPSQIAEELDIDPQGAGSPFFDRGIVEKHIHDKAREPDLICELDFSPLDCEPEGLIEQANGHLHVWGKLDLGQPPTHRRYVIGCDVSMGTGVSNSCLSVVDVHSGEKVSLLTNPHLDPLDLADYAVALAKFYNKATLIWEAQGPGVTFAKQVKARRYANVYKRKGKGRLQLEEKPGWGSNAELKRNLLIRYQHALAKLQFINHSLESLRECFDFIYDNARNVVHVSSLNDMDPSGAGDNHGDRVMADALANMLLEARAPNAPEKDDGERHEGPPPPGSVAYLEKMYKEQERRESQEAW